MYNVVRLIIYYLCSRIREDLQDQEDICLIDPMGECTQPLLNLMIFGVATPYLHNGTLILGDVEEGKGVSIQCPEKAALSLKLFWVFIRLPFFI